MPPYLPPKFEVLPGVLLKGCVDMT